MQFEFKVFFIYILLEHEHCLYFLVRYSGTNLTSVKWPYASECGLQLTAKVLRHANRLDPHINRMHTAEEAFYQIDIQ